MKKRIASVVIRAQVDVLEDDGKLKNREITPDMVVYEADLGEIEGLMDFLKRKGWKEEG